MPVVFAKLDDLKRLHGMDPHPGYRNHVEDLASGSSQSDQAQDVKIDGDQTPWLSTVCGGSSAHAHPCIRRLGDRRGYWVPVALSAKRTRERARRSAARNSVVLTCMTPYCAVSLRSSSRRSSLAASRPAGTTSVRRRSASW